ncbi:LOW QUALITY PROTEIN: hypothetical protein PHMEG_00023622 [Phytophthora megakarya]|uniref:SWIM-type domain-containing protein n=1 Tax=Phytophthora megakarya TaxID=4795 RepID=A0A225VHN0_9STRA|nr:LOW QUALITY PROTEIN: hypothetical protein PHMEG_00023622 [Phytophthora megakarya]
MIYADSSSSYEMAHVASGGLCDRIGNIGFLAYFVKNWHTSQERWVMNQKSDLPHYRNHTNSRLESQFVNSNYDEKMANVLHFTNPYVAGHVEKEYVLAIERFDSYTFTRYEKEGHIVHVVGGKKAYALRDDDWRCNCEFSVSLCLPCRHVIAFRKSSSERFVMTTGVVIVNSLCRCAYLAVIPQRALNSGGQFSYERFSSDVGGAARTMLTQSQRYAEALRVTQLIASELADIENDDVFRRMVDYEKQQWRNEEEMEENKSSEDERVDKVLSSAPKIRLIPKARKVVRRNRRHIPGERQDRKWFEAAETGRRSAEDVSLERVLDNLDREQPRLVETQRRLSGILIKFAEFNSKKPKFKRQKNPALILDAFYLLPPKLLDVCITVLPVANTNSCAISVDESASQE